MYAEKIGRASFRSPREMMIPIGSSDSVISRTFFIVLSVFEPVVAAGEALQGTPDAKGIQIHKSLLFHDL